MSTFTTDVVGNPAKPLTETLDDDLIGLLLKLSGGIKA